MAMEAPKRRKPRVLCLHGFRGSSKILQKLIGRWPESVLLKLDLVFLDGPIPAQGKSDLEPVFDPPFYEWFQANQDFTEYTNLEECVAYLEDYMVKNGLFDGLLAFSQTAILSAALPGMQSQDFLKEEGIALLEALVDPLVIYHPKGHTVPRLGDKGVATMLAFIEKIQRIPSNVRSRI